MSTSHEVSHLRARLEESEARFDTLMASVVDALIVIDEHGSIQAANPSAENIFGYREAELIGANVKLLMPEPERGRHDGYIAHYLRTGEAKIIGIGREVVGQKRDGSEVPLELAISEFTLSGKRCFTGVLRDISDRKRDEEAVRKSEHRLADAQRLARVGSWEWDIATGSIECSVQHCRNLGWSPDASGLTYDAFLSSVHHGDRARIDSVVRGCVESGDAATFDFRAPWPDGQVRHIRGQCEVEQAESRNPARLTGTTQDMTEFRTIEEQLSQAHKMEALGQLTGGVAHDFNNLLAVIMMDLDMIGELTAGNEEAGELVDEAKDVSRTGAELTQRLLAFARRQRLEPELVDPGALIADVKQLLRRTLGENIAIETTAAPGLWSVRVDPRQLQNALLNLALNARDAMPNGGRLTIRATNGSLDAPGVATGLGLAADRYVAIEMEDTGTGMERDTIDRAFEPFFTTKDELGSGLGLSMVYGFVKQSDGHVGIDSDVGHGTIVKIYLPRADAEISDRPSREKVTDLRGHEVILLVEDHEQLRRRAAGALARFGYRVLEATDGESALARLEAEPRVDLLLSDVVMPGKLNGPALARAVRRQRPAIKVLLTTGYAGSGELPRGNDEAAMRVLDKPYTIKSLAHSVREVLDG